MRILVVAPARTGGRTFSRWLSDELNYRWIHEPFNPNHAQIFNMEHVMTMDNVVVKVVPREWENVLFDEELFERFDVIIGLTRVDVMDSAISFAKAKQTNNFIKPYNIDNKWIEDNSEAIEMDCMVLRLMSDYTRNIKDSFQITYEGLYKTNQDLYRVMDKFKIDEARYLDMFNNDKRYRNNLNLI
jgi:hypothetical protein